MTLQSKTIEQLGALTSDRFSTEESSLVVVKGPHEGLVLPLDREYIRIGRAEWCDLVLSDDNWVSNIHCECFLDETGVRVRDALSRNGIKINETQVFEAPLKKGSSLQVGRSVLQLQSHQNNKREIPVYYRDETGTLIGKSIEMRKIFSMLPRLGERRVTTLLTGETGTGKTSIARAIHQHGEPDAPFVVVNCGALPANLIEATLFGHEKGAFTGAAKTHNGLFQQANGGTLFMDEIGELPLELQPKLLDVLERKKIRRLGGDREYDVDFRLLAATHRDLHKEIQRGNFRKDLYFRLSVVEMEVPPLRERREDLPLLVEALLMELSPQHHIFITPAAMRMLEEQLWPGNLRQLRNTLERSLTFLDDDTLEAENLVIPQLEELRGPGEAGTSGGESAHPLAGALPELPLMEHDPHTPLKGLMRQFEKALIVQALKETPNAPAAAQLLQISESWLYSRISTYGLGKRRKKKADKES